MSHIIHQSTTQHIMRRMLRCYATSPFAFLFRTIEIQAMVALAARHGIDLTDQVAVDVGCGNGALGQAFIRQITLGFDLSRTDVLHVYRHKSAYRHAICASATAIPLSAQSQPVVFSNSVIEHIPDAAATWDELARIVQPGGWLILSTVSEQFPALMLGTPAPSASARAELDRSYAHYHYYSVATVESDLTRRGLTLVDHTTYIDPRQARQSHQLRLWEQQQRTTSTLQHRYQQLRRVPVTLQQLRYLSPVETDPGNGAALAIVARRV
ncbi:MAG: class I SAM-dependent methyltransferase [Chloroflexaceae bacterium]|nr:class I SAM-dependent methyltransferase [Chloroflexaceae bacterium]